ncbi:hypothetical protein ACFXKC_55525 [Streptomyces sp. NPDC059340]|uniref:hypothetical protein n=1 Tax=Streptomyces sp. NPDC059340 TaxID=3346806 RepID=UPI0036AA1026
MTPTLPRRRTVLALAVTAVVAAGATACGTQDTSVTKPASAGTASSPRSQKAAEVTTIGDQKIKVPGDKPKA